MDEPASALDPIATLAIEELIRGLSQRYTIVIVTHNMQQAARVSDEAAFNKLSLAEASGYVSLRSLVTRVGEYLLSKVVLHQVAGPVIVNHQEGRIP